MIISFELSTTCYVVVHTFHITRKLIKPKVRAASFGDFIITYFTFVKYLLILSQNF